MALKFKVTLILTQALALLLAGVVCIDYSDPVDPSFNSHAYLTAPSVSTSRLAEQVATGVSIAELKRESVLLDDNGRLPVVDALLNKVKAGFSRDLVSTGAGHGGRQYANAKLHVQADYVDNADFMYDNTANAHNPNPFPLLLIAAVFFGYGVVFRKQKYFDIGGSADFDRYGHGLANTHDQKSI